MNSKPISYWNQTADRKGRPAAEQDLQTEVLIVGGGITGVTCAWCLAQKGLRPVLLEAGEIGGGTTGNTTGKLTLQHGIIYSRIARRYGDGYARLYAEAQDGAIHFIRQRVEAGSIACQLADSTAFLYAAREGGRRTMEKEYKAALRLGIQADLLHHPDFPEGSLSLLGFRNQAVFHPLRYLDALCEEAVSFGAQVYGHTKAVRIEDGDEISVFCESGIRVRTKQLVVATQYPICGGPFRFFPRLYAKRSYGIAVKAKRDWPDGSFIGVDPPVFSIRTHVEHGQRILIVVGEGHPTGRGIADARVHFDRLAGFAEQLAGVERLLASWSAQDYETPDQIPFIGRLPDCSRIFFASGFGKWGLSNGTLAGRMLAELIHEGHSRFETLFSLKRADFLHAPGKAAVENLASISELVSSQWEQPGKLRGLRRGEGRVIEYKGIKAGAYRDEDDRVTVLDIHCAHMKTLLRFNPAERTWDCAAHGGRFDTDGHPLEGPPRKALKIYFKGPYDALPHMQE